MQGFHGMQEQCRRPSRTQRSRNLAGDEPALAHASDYHPSGTAVQQLHCAAECLRHGAGNAVGQGPKGFSFNADNVFANAIHGRKDDNKNVATDLRGSTQIKQATN